MRIPVIFKEAFNANQLRGMKKFVKITRNPAATANMHHVFGTGETVINIPRGDKNPIYTLAHEFGHYVDEVYKRRGLPELANNNILDEIMANRYGARYLAHTGSRPSEIKGFVRSRMGPLNTYKMPQDWDFISEALKKYKGAIPPDAAREYAKLPDSMTTLDERAQRSIRGIAESIANDKQINLDVIKPFVRARSGIDLSSVGRNAAKLKDKEREAFNEYLKRARPKRVIGTPEVIHL